jgi:NAD(P)-dependent dehydrogenase (short-subunit alcohol dehydrogenase family)
MEPVLDLTNPRVALVTGANRGIGVEVCRQLARQGLRVILCGRDLDKAEAAARRLGQAHLDITPAALDVTNADSIHAVAQVVEERFGGIDVLVNNAAILLAENADVLDIASDDFRASFETNVLGAIVVSQAFVPGMIKRRYGRIVNVSSTSTIGPSAFRRKWSPAGPVESIQSWRSGTNSAAMSFRGTLAAPAQGQPLGYGRGGAPWML